MSGNLLLWTKGLHFTKIRYVKPLNPSVMIFEGGAFGKLITLRRGHKGKASMMGLVA